SGSVFVEALVYVPFLILVWVALGDVHRVGRARFAAHAQARTCGWTFAVNGEPDATAPPCEVREREGAEAELTTGAAWSRLLAALPEVRDALPSLLGSAFDSERAGAVA